MVKVLVSYVAGFISGVLVTSNKLDRNPNDVFRELKEDAKNSATATGNFFKDKFNKKEDDVVVVDFDHDQFAQDARDLGMTVEEV